MLAHLLIVALVVIAASGGAAFEFKLSPTDKGWFAQLPLCTSPEVIKGLDEFLQKQERYRGLVRELENAEAAWKDFPNERPYFPSGTTSKHNQFLMELARERFQSAWTGPYCRAGLLPNGTIVTPRDQIFDRVSYLDMKTRFTFEATDCATLERYNLVEFDIMGVCKPGYVRELITGTYFTCIVDCVGGFGQPVVTILE